jgi:hypothetical protein
MGARARKDCSAKLSARRAVWAALACAVTLGCASSGARASLLLAGEQRVAPNRAISAFGDMLIPTDQQALLLEARNLGLAALAEGMRDDPEIRDILRDVMPVVDLAQLANDIDDRSDPAQLQPAAAAGAQPTAARDRSDVTRDPGVDDPAVELDEDGGLSLRQVLHSIASPSKRIGGGSGRSSDDGDDVDDDDDGSGSLTSRLLESRFLGAAMEHVIEVNSIDNSFSVFGVGRFELSLGDNHNFILTDMSNNVTVDVGQDAAPDPVQHQFHSAPSDKIDIVGLLVGYLLSPTGVFVSICGGTFLFLWSTVRMAARLMR